MSCMQVIFILLKNKGLTNHSGLMLYLVMNTMNLAQEIIWNLGLTGLINQPHQ